MTWLDIPVGSMFKIKDNDILYCKVNNADDDINSTSMDDGDGVFIDRRTEVIPLNDEQFKEWMDSEQ